MRKLSILSYIFAGLMLSSCDGYLKEDPRDQLYPEDAYDTPQNVYLNTVASLYNYIGGYSDSQGLQGTYRGVYDLNTFTTDEAMLPTRGGDWYDGGFWQGLFLHKWGTNSDAIQATWEYLYKVIVLSNQSLEILGELRQKTDYNDLDRYEAEVRALRAMYYYYLVDMSPVSSGRRSCRVRRSRAGSPVMSRATSCKVTSRLGYTVAGRDTRPVRLSLTGEIGAAKRDILNSFFMYSFS